MLSFRDGPKEQTRNLEIPGSLVSRAPRNDGRKPPPRRLRLHPFELRQLMPEPGELPLGVVAGVGAADVSGFVERDFTADMLDQRRDSVRLHGGQERIK